LHHFTLAGIAAIFAASAINFEEEKKEDSSPFYPFLCLII